MLAFLRRLFAPPVLPAAENAPARRGETAQATFRMADVFPGQVNHTTLLFNDRLILMGRELVGADTEISSEISTQINDQAHAQGQAWAAAPYDENGRKSDGRSEAFRVERDKEFASIQTGLAGAQSSLNGAISGLDEVPDADPDLAYLGYALAGIAGVAGTVVLSPTISALLGPSFAELVGADSAVAAGWAGALMFGFAPPLLSMGAASLRASWQKIFGFGVLELACLALLAWSRVGLLAIPIVGTNVNPAIAAMVAGQAEARSTMMFALESLLVVAVTGIGMQVSTHLTKADTRRKAEERAERAQEELGLVQEARAALAEWRDLDLVELTKRDVESERGDKVDKLCRALILHGAHLQAQDNRALLSGLPRAKARPDTVFAG